MKISFSKYEGTGNDFIIIDDRDCTFNVENYRRIALICDREEGIGADGLILLRDHKRYDFEMIYFNSDGKESTMCGNGGRCIVAFANTLGIINNKCIFLACDGAHHAELHQDVVKLQMQDVSTINRLEEDVFVLNTGSPHYVKVTSRIDDIDVRVEGAAIRNSPSFKAEGINVNFLESGEKARIRSYERGVEDETLSCGTGTVACAIVLHEIGNNKKDNKIISSSIITKGGELHVEFQVANNIYSNIFLEGPSKLVFNGEFPC